MRKQDGKIILEAAPPRSLLSILASLSPISDAFPRIEDPAPSPLDL
jgi:hypothetical protein